MQKYISLLARLLIAVFLLALLYHTDHLKLNVLKINIKYFLWTIPFYIVAILAGIYRWWFLVRAVKLPLTLWDTVRLSMTGLWFSSILPGGSLIGGDIVRAASFAIENSEQRTMAVVSIFIDRLTGMLAILIISSIALFCNMALLMKNPWLQIIAAVLVFLISTIFIFTVIALSEKFYTWISSIQFLRKIPLYAIFKKIIDSIYLYRKYPRALLSAHLISYLGHISMILGIYVLAVAIGIKLETVAEYIFAIGVGVTSAMIPISGPAGIGAGNVGFAATFGLLNSAYGAELALCWQGTFILFSQFGMPFFFFKRRKALPSKEQIKIIN